MYFVVFLKDVQKSIIIPKRWLRDSDKYIEKFVNYSLNSAQTHLYYWNSSKDAITQNGQPNPAFPPNFEADIKMSFPCTEGCYKCRVLKCKIHYEEAAEFMSKRRDQLSAVYNDRRLNEVPIPDLSHISQATFLNSHENLYWENASMDSPSEELSIPKEHANAVVLLHRVEDQMFRENSQQNAEMNFMAEIDSTYNFNLFADNEFAVDYNEPVNDPQEVVVKYEITHGQNELDEIDGILEENEPAESQNVPNTTTDVDVYDSNDAVVSTSGAWNVQVQVNPQNQCKSKSLKAAKIDGTFVESKKKWHVETTSIETGCNMAMSSVFETNDSTFDAPRNKLSKFSPEVESSAKLVDEEFDHHEDEPSHVSSTIAPVVSTTGTDHDENITNVNDTDVSETDGERANDLDDDLYVVTEPGQAWPLPKKFELDGYIKRERDRFSGDLPFRQGNKDGKSWREYIIGFDRIIKVTEKNVNTFIQWSTYPFVNEVKYDRKLAHAMLILCSSKKELSQRRVNCDVHEFKKHLLNIRVKGDSQRMDKMLEYFQEILEKKCAKEQ